MALGRIPGLKVDRTGIALMAVAILLVSVGAIQLRPGAALKPSTAPTLVLMFALMILSAQFGDARGSTMPAPRRIVAAAPRESPAYCWPSW